MHPVALLVTVLMTALGDVTRAWSDSVTPPYSAATRVAVIETARRGLHRAAAYVCWGEAAERRLVRALSSAGVAVNLFRGREHTTATAVEALLREGGGRTAILVDASCPAADRLLVMASRLRLFDPANFWFVFENGRLETPTEDLGGSNSSRDTYDVEFPNPELVVTGRYGAQERDDALQPGEKVLLEVVAPSARPRPLEQPPLTSLVSLLSPAVRRSLEPLLVLSDGEVLVVQAAPQDDDAARQLQGFVVFRTSMARGLQAYLAAEGSVDRLKGTWWEWILSPQEEHVIQQRRADLENATLRAPIIINFPKEYTFIEDLRERKRDYRPKTNFPVVKNMAEQANVK